MSYSKQPYEQVAAKYRQAVRAHALSGPLGAAERYLEPALVLIQPDAPLLNHILDTLLVFATKTAPLKSERPMMNATKALYAYTQGVRDGITLPATGATVDMELLLPSYTDLAGWQKLIHACTATNLSVPSRPGRSNQDLVRDNPSWRAWLKANNTPWGLGEKTRGLQFFKPESLHDAFPLPQPPARAQPTGFTFEL